MWLSDTDRYMLCRLVMGLTPYLTLKNKASFYSLLKNFYKRPICVFDRSISKETFEAFVNTTSKLFIKPLSGSLGANTFIVERSGYYSLFDRLKNEDEEWLIEGAINQVREMAIWNDSSVNTVRVPSFKVNGEIHILQPFFRTGRKGQIVDNAGAGGILCVVDEVTGVVKTNGYDEQYNKYKYHPDSNVEYMGWQVPKWGDLCKLVKNVHMNLPDNFIYVGFDFALTDYGWDLIEGNWGQMVGQIAEQKGIKKEFDAYLGI